LGARAEALEPLRRNRLDGRNEHQGKEGGKWHNLDIKDNFD
jgi:hypothetical protein